MKAVSVIKRDGTREDFDIGKIRESISRAAEEAGAPVPDDVMERVCADICARVGGLASGEVSSDGLSELVSLAMKEAGGDGMKDAASRYSGYSSAKNGIRVVGGGEGGGGKADVTDQFLLLVNSDTESDVFGWSRERIAKKLEASFPKMGARKARAIAKTVEKRIAGGGYTSISTSLIREMVNEELKKAGFGVMEDMKMYTISKEFIDSLLFRKSDENSNIKANNPEAVNASIAGYVIKKYTFDNILPKEVSDAHFSGRIHFHDADFGATRVYAFSGGTPVVAKVGGRCACTTLRRLWDSIDAVEEPLNATQSRKSLDGMEVTIKDRGSDVRIEQLVLSREVKKAKRINAVGGVSLSVTDEHGVVVSRDGKYMIVRADEVLLTDKLVRNR